jgi:DNA integrity scanning protein DisA with diadenylate cyclase activity
MSGSDTNRLRRLAEELTESGLPLGESAEEREMLLEEIDHALRPTVHERRVASGGTILDPRSDPSTWSRGTQLEIAVLPLDDQPLPAARRFADGQSTWLLRRTDGRPKWLIFDRPTSSERDLVVLAATLEATIVQRHPSGTVRVVGPFGVFRWEGLRWRHEPPVGSWIDTLTACASHGDPTVLEAMLEFAVHDLGSMGIGSLLIYRPDAAPGPAVEERLPVPPPLEICRASHLAPLRHALAQVDGAAVFDAAGVLFLLGVRLVPSIDAEGNVDALGGTRHTSGRRYSYDDPLATVIAVSEDGPVSVLRHGNVLGRSRRTD